MPHFYTHVYTNVYTHAYAHVHMHVDAHVYVHVYATYLYTCLWHMSMHASAANICNACLQTGPYTCRTRAYACAHACLHTCPFHIRGTDSWMAELLRFMLGDYRRLRHKDQAMTT